MTPVNSAEKEVFKKIEEVQPVPPLADVAKQSFAEQARQMTTDLKQKKREVKALEKELQTLQAKALGLPNPADDSDN